MEAEEGLGEAQIAGNHGADEEDGAAWEAGAAGAEEAEEEVREVGEAGGSKEEGGGAGRIGKQIKEGGLLPLSGLLGG